MRRMAFLLALMIRSVLYAGDTAGGTIEDLRELGEKKIQEKAFPEALSLFQELAAKSPRDLGALIRLADLYSWTGNFDHAVALFKDVISRDTLNLAALKGLARVMRWSTRFADAEELYERVLRLEPNDIECLTGLAVLYARERNFESAFAAIERANKASPDNPAVLMVKGDILAWSNRYTEAEEAYQAARALTPASPEVYRSLGDVYTWSGRFRKALESYKAASKCDPRNIECLADVAEAALSADMPAEAELAVQRMFTIAPEDSRTKKMVRELEMRGGVDVRRILVEDVKPLSLICSITFIALFFRKKRDIIQRRHPLFWRFAYQFLPVLLVVYIVAFIVVRNGGFPEAGLMEDAAELFTFLFLVGGFITLVWVSRVQERAKLKSVLAVGAHPDDIELGCGGTLAKLNEMGYKVYGLVITNGERGILYTDDKACRQEEAEKGASVLGLDGLWIYNFNDTSLESQLNAIKDVIEQKLKETGADLLITQSPHDLHQDHRAVFEASKIAARGDKTVLCYEDVSTESHFDANFFVDVTDYLDDKILAVQSHRTQRRKRYMHPDNIRGRAAHRGLQSGVKYAEAFLLYKGVDTWAS